MTLSWHATLFSDFAKQLAAPFDLFVNDAFGTAHRAHGSTEGVTKFLSPSVAGFLLQKELDYLEGAVKEPKRPFAAIVGGSKVSSKIGKDNYEIVGNQCVMDESILARHRVFCGVTWASSLIKSYVLGNDILVLKSKISSHRRYQAAV